MMPKASLAEIEAFLVVAHAGSLAAAARQAGTSEQRLRIAIEALEARIGARLFERIGRSLRLTRLGLDNLHAARAVFQSASTMAARGAVNGHFPSLLQRARYLHQRQCT